MKITPKQISLMTKLLSIVAEIGENCGESSHLHFKARDFEHELNEYFENGIDWDCKKSV